MKKSREITDNHLRKFFASYWLLNSALYDFALGLENQRNRRFTWAITNYYYSLVFVGRLLMFLATDLYYTGHREIAQFFSGESVRGKAFKLNRYGDFEEISGVRGNQENNRNRNVDNQRTYICLTEIINKLNIEKRKIKDFGEVLKNLKDFRNKNTYESFIIYAQENHSVLTDFMMSATDSIRNIAESYLKEACKIFFNYWKSQNENIVKLLRHPWLIPTTLNMLKVHKLPYNTIETIIKRGFYFENEKVYSSERLEEVSQIIKDTMPAPHITDKEFIWVVDDNLKAIREKFEKVCRISEFDAKKKIANDAFEIFRDLIKLCEGDQL